MFLVIILFVPLLFALLTYLAGNKFAKYMALAGGALSLSGMVVLRAMFKSTNYAPITFSHAWITNPNIAFSLSVDGLALVLIGLTLLLVPLIVLTTFNKVIDNAKAFYSLILLMEFGLLGVFMASDGFLYYIFWELALIPIYFIALLWGENRDQDFRSCAIFKFFIYTLAGSLLMLIGFIYLYQSSGSFSVDALYRLNLSDKEQSFLFWAFFIAFAIKIPIFPFHTWQPDTYKEAPAAGTMLLAGIMLKMGLYSLMRWLLPVVPHGVMLWTPLVIALSVTGVIYGSVIAIKQDDLKRLLAYSSFAHVGLISAGIFTLTREGMQGAVLQMFAHGVNVVALFFAADIIYQRTGTHSISQLGGIRNMAPKFATCFLLVVLASVALPTTNAFIGEFLLLYGIYEYNTILSAVAGLTIILGAVYMLRMYQYSMLGEPGNATGVFTDLSKSEFLVFAVVILFIFAMGVAPKPFMSLIGPSVDNILNHSLR